MPKQPLKTRAPSKSPGVRPEGALSVSPLIVWLSALIPVTAAVAVHAQAFRYGFIWDDPLVLQQLRAIHGARDLFVLPEEVPKLYYRPFIFLTFLVDRALGGESPFWFHALVIGAHALATLLVFLLARRLLGTTHTLESGLAALLFAVHPIHVESVAWIAGRSDVVATVFVVVTVLLSAATTRMATAWAAGASMLLALFSKEVAIVLLILVPARDLLIDRRLLWPRYAPLFVVTALYLVLRYVGLGEVGTGMPSQASTVDQGRDLLAAVGWYAAKLLVPANLTAYVPTVPASAAYVVGGTITLITVGAAIVWAASTGRGVPAFLLIWFVVTLAPSLGVIVRRSASAPIADRYLYLPSVAGVLLVAWLISRLRPVQSWRWRAAAVAAGGVAVLWSVQSVARTRIWSEPLGFWSDVVAKAPQAGMPYRERGNVYLDLNQLDEAERDFRAAALYEKEMEGRVMNYNNYGNLYLRRNQLAAAETAYRSGLQLYQHAFLYSGLGRVEIRRAEQAQADGNAEQAMQHVRQAREYLERAVTLDARDFKSRVLLGQVLFNLGEKAGARQQFESALQIEPRGAVADSARRFLSRLQ